MTWFAEQITPYGRIAPVTFHGDEPRLATANGPRRLVGDRIVKIEPTDEGLSLDALQARYGATPDAPIFVSRRTAT
jgi:hypothetical protein